MKIKHEMKNFGKLASGRGYAVAHESYVSRNIFNLVSIYNYDLEKFLKEFKKELQDYNFYVNVLMDLTFYDSIIAVEVEVVTSFGYSNHYVGDKFTIYFNKVEKNVRDYIIDVYIKGE